MAVRTVFQPALQPRNWWATAHTKALAIATMSQPVIAPLMPEPMAAQVPDPAAASSCRGVRRAATRARASSLGGPGRRWPPTQPCSRSQAGILEVGDRVGNVGRQLLQNLGLKLVGQREVTVDFAEIAVLRVHQSAPLATAATPPVKAFHSARALASCRLPAGVSR